MAEPTQEKLDELLDEALEESFPASDPPNIVQPHAPEDLDPISEDDD